MNPKQCKMARAGLGWSLDKLKDKSGIGRATIQRFESSKDSFVSTAERIKKTFEAHGVTFQGEDCVCVKPSEQSDVKDNLSNT